MPKTKERDGWFSIGVIVWIIMYFGPLHDQANWFLDTVVRPFIR